jgi:hypothetical protein
MPPKELITRLQRRTEESAQIEQQWSPKQSVDSMPPQRPPAHGAAFARDEDTVENQLEQADPNAPSAACDQEHYHHACVPFLQRSGRQRVP